MIELLVVTVTAPPPRVDAISRVTYITSRYRKLAAGPGQGKSRHARRGRVLKSRHITNDDPARASHKPGNQPSQQLLPAITLHPSHLVALRTAWLRTPPVRSAAAPTEAMIEIPLILLGI
jgi:hypothetical protein